MMMMTAAPGQPASTSTFPCTICKCLWLDFLHPCTLAQKTADSQRGGEILYGKPLLTWQSSKIMAAVTVADRRRSVISAVFCTLVVRCIPVLQLQRHHRSHIPLPTSLLQKTGRPGQDDSPYHTLRQCGVHGRGVSQRRARNGKWQSETKRVNPHYVNILYVRNVDRHVLNRDTSF